jgi:hypothetical protein
MSSITSLEYQRTFEEAWADSRHTTFDLPSVDINRLLAERYTTDPSVTFTREMLWDASVRTARRPDRYLPGIVQDGSAETWATRELRDGTEFFLRASLQRLWLAPAEYGLVLEQTLLDHRAQTVTFIGASELEGPDGEPVRATHGQPLFHVQHSVAQQPAQPLSAGRIVHLTDTPDAELLEAFTRLEQHPWLPQHLETYITEDMGARLTRREPSLDPHSVNTYVG